MRIGCCLNMNAAGEPRTGAEGIPLFRELGYDYVELPLAQVMELPAAAFRELTGTVRGAGIPVEACNNFFPPQIRLTGEEARPRAALDYLGAALDRAAALGVKIIVLGSSGAKNIPPGFPYPRARAQFAELLARIDQAVRPLGITVALEPLNKRESNFITTAGEALALVRELSLGGIKLLIDYYHLRMEDEGPPVIGEAGPELRHLHIASKEGRRFPRQGDGEDYRGFFTRLRAAGYDERVSVEAYSQDLPGEGAASLRFLRELAAETA
jgi:sugar phosphate isomerase/epimerase